jgi:hypothetical protein
MIVFMMTSTVELLIVRTPEAMTSFVASAHFVRILLFSALYTSLALLLKTFGRSSLRAWNSDSQSARYALFPSACNSGFPR